MSDIGGKDLLEQIEEENPKLGIFLRSYVIPAIQTTADNSAVSPVADIEPPAPPESVDVKTSGEMVQVVVNHNAPLQKGAHYIYSIATNDQFSGAMIEPKPATRAPMHFTLPTKDAGGNNHNYRLAVQVQYPGSAPSAPTYYGGVSPASFTLGGTTQMDLLAGTGSGTAQNGGQALVGLGKAQVRL